VRRLEKVTLVPAPVGSFASVWTVPANHKYELVQASPSCFGGAATTFYIARQIGAAVFFTDHIALAAGVFDGTRQYHDLLFNEGDQLLAGFIGAGAGGEAAVFDYVDVAFV